MADSVARCLYGFSNAPISATISVSESSGGEKNVATTSVSDAGGWLHLAAYNFQFSNPTISAKLTQASASTTTTTIKKATPVVFKKVISCRWNKPPKSTFKVAAVKPVCPAGSTKV